LPVKVISVGNISLGGTGKTPAIVFFADHLIKSGKKVGIVSRGYGRKNRNIKVLINADNNSKVEDYGDEPIFLSSRLRNIPVAVGADKLNAALQLIKKNKVDVLLFDDGFQTRKIYRDLDIVLLNALNGIKDYRMVPFGILREPVKFIGRADFVIFTKDNLINPESKVSHLIGKYINNNVFYSSYKLEKIFSESSKYNFNKDKVIAISGVGDPRSFELSLLKENVNILYHFKFRDHHNYDQTDINIIAKTLKTMNALSIVTTEKDYVKLKKLDISKINLKFFIVKSNFYLNKQSTQKIFSKII
tara:strand:- start:49 stop:957 length:909 start_codon:yes stop_codon:yes gene_type:complete